MQIQPIVVGTAGHIDHGKSTLVQILTGVDPDRWEEEKARGMTIDLGFARFDLPDGRRIGIVDVPGHERLVRNMVAGATGIDLVMLVVAADDGVMPQTREHLAILELLGVERGLIVLTKIDLVEDELRELVELDVQETVQGTFLEDAPILPYSAVTKEGLPELQAALIEAASAVPPHSDQGIFRMPIQRVFSARGFGTIVTGIPVAGRVQVGDTLEILPLGQKGKVRGLQAYHDKVEVAQAGHSTAINLSDVDHHSVHRGMVVAKPGYFGAVRLFGARLKAVPSLPIPIQNRMSIRVHVGTAEGLGEVILLDQEVIEGGGEGLVQLRLKEPLVCAPGDRFVLRLASPMITLGGGVILEESRYRLKRFKGFVLEGLAQREASLGSEEDLLESILTSAPEGWMDLAAIGHAFKQPVDHTEALLRRLECEQRVAPMVGNRWIAVEALQHFQQAVRRAVTEWFEGHAHRVRMDIRELRSQVKIDPGLLDALIAEMARAGTLERESGGVLRLPGHEARLPEAWQAVAQGLRQAYSEAQFQPPTTEELAPEWTRDGAALRGTLEYLCDAGELEHVGADLYMDHEAMEEIRRRVVDNCRRNGELAIAELRDGLGTSRKYLIPVLEALDAEGLTQRKGSTRTLKT